MSKSSGGGSNNRVRLKCSSSIADFYWKSAEITLLQEKPKFASVMKTGAAAGEKEDPAGDNHVGDKEQGTHSRGREN